MPPVCVEQGEPARLPPGEAVLVIGLLTVMSMALLVLMGVAVALIWDVWGVLPLVFLAGVLFRPTLGLLVGRVP